MNLHSQDDKSPEEARKFYQDFVEEVKRTVPREKLLVYRIGKTYVCQKGHGSRSKVTFGEEARGKREVPSSAVGDRRRRKDM